MGTVFLSTFANPIDSTFAFASLAGTVTSTTSVTAAEAWDRNAFTMPGGCTFNSMYVTAAAVDQTYVAANALTYTLYKNNVATSVILSLNAPTSLSAPTSTSATGFSVPVVTGDKLAIGLTQTNGANSALWNLVTLRCQ